jgi:hypothetical protein
MCQPNYKSVHPLTRCQISEAVELAKEKIKALDEVSITTHRKGERDLEVLFGTVLKDFFNEDQK